MLGTVPLLTARDVEASARAELERTLIRTIEPFIESYCIECHGGNEPAADLDLRAFAAPDALIRDDPRLVRMRDRLEAGEMPPDEARQPPDDLRRRVVAWLDTVRADEARRNAGDPGPVPLRRLSNSEYDNTVRDLTGVDMRLTREFPVDPANSAGFDNSGESLSMSPTLLAKYLEAARRVGDQLVLTPDGFRFAPHPMLVDTDREKYAIKRIVDFYDRQPTDYVDYFEAAWRFRHRAALRKPSATLTEVATDACVSVEYLNSVWRILEGATDASDRVGPIAKLRALWRALPGPDASQDAVRAGCVEMRDFVVRIRHHTVEQFEAPVVDGLGITSQPLMSWKLRAFASHRMDFDRGALRIAGEPPPRGSEPSEEAHGHEGTSRAAVQSARRRASDPDLEVPKDEWGVYETSFARFCSVFPDAFYVRERGLFFPDYSRDRGRLLSAGYHNVTGFFRDDAPLVELILDDDGRRELDALWEEFDFIADHSLRTWVQFLFDKSGEVEGRGRGSGWERPSPDLDVGASSVVFELRDAYLARARVSDDPAALAAIREHFRRVDETLRAVEHMRACAEPLHRRALLEFAERAYRRPLARSERDALAAHYETLRYGSGLTHEEAMRDSIVGVLMSPKFLYRLERIEVGTDDGWREASDDSSAAPARVELVQPLSGHALASRLSYFLWSSMPDEELLAHAAGGDLRDPAVVVAQARRMLKDPRVRGLVVDFAGNWLGFRRFEEHNAVDRERFPSFDKKLRSAMFLEPVKFIENVIRDDGSVLDLLYGTHTFVNSTLAEHYAIPASIAGDEWIRIDDARPHGRGGLLTMAVLLTQNAHGLRTSPVKRGYWVASRLLGEAISPPPDSVPRLPEDEATSELRMSALLERHAADPSCASCHARFDSLGLVFEGYGPIGERRSADLAQRPVDTRVSFPNGEFGDGPEDLRSYVREHREGEFADTLCRKLLAFGLGRSLLPSDELLVERMRAELAESFYRFAPLVEAIVTSRQFLYRRCADPSEQEEG